jgi:hypothetical protein
LNDRGTKNPGLETQPWAGICERLRRSEFLCKARLRPIRLTMCSVKTSVGGY